MLFHLPGKDWKKFANFIKTSNISGNKWTIDDTIDGRIIHKSMAAVKSTGTLVVSIWNGNKNMIFLRS